MELLNKIANVVVTNPLVKEYEMMDDVCQAGPWVFHSAVKRSTKEKVSVFVLSKKIFEKMSKQLREQLLERYRCGVKLLTKIRHPRFLTIEHPLEESRECLAFATEPCTSSLEYIIKNKSLTDIEVKYGILQLLDGVSFLHNELKLCHRNICPYSIVVNKQGLWKVFGLEFNCVSEESSEPPPPEFLFYDERPAFSQPNLKYVAPELLSNNFSGTSADMYSLGCLIFALFNNGRVLRHGETVSKALDQSMDIANTSNDTLGKVPNDGKDDLKNLLSTSPQMRKKVESFYQATFLNDIGALSLQFLDNIMLKNRNQKINFFKELPDVLPRLSSNVKKGRILSQLFECCKEVDMIPFVLPSIFYIGDDIEVSDFQQLVSPGLHPILEIKEPPHISMIIVQNLNLLVSKSKLEETKIFVIPLLFRCLESSLIELQERVLKLLPGVVDLMDYAILRHQLLPKIKTCCLETRLLRIRVASLICIGNILDSNFVDKTIVDDILLPLLEQVPSKEPAVLMSILGIYQKLLKHKLNLLDKDVLANRCVPIIFPMLVAPSLNVKQFKTCLSIIKEMINKVEVQQLAKLQQLQETKSEQEQSLSFSKNVAENKQVGELVSKMDEMFGSSPNEMAKAHIDHRKVPSSLGNTVEHEKRDARSDKIDSNPTVFDSTMFDMVSDVSKPTITNQKTPNNNLMNFSDTGMNISNQLGTLQHQPQYGTRNLASNFLPNNSAPCYHHPSSSIVTSSSMSNAFIRRNHAASLPPNQKFNSLDDLFGPKPTQPSLSQLANCGTRQENISSNQAKSQQQAPLDINDIFG